MDNFREERANSCPYTNPTKQRQSVARQVYAFVTLYGTNTYGNWKSVVEKH